MFERAGASPVALPASEVYTSLDKGVIDAADFSSYTMDESVGLHEIATFPIYPGIHSMPVIQFTVNKAAWDSLTPAQQTILDVWYRAMIDDLAMMNEITDRELVARDMARRRASVEVINWSKEDRDKLRAIAAEAWAEFAEGDELDQARLRGQHRVHEEDRPALSGSGRGRPRRPAPRASPMRMIDRLNRLLGERLCYLYLVAVAITAYEVVMRYLFHRADLLGVRADDPARARSATCCPAASSPLQRRHIAITSVYDLMPAPIRWWLDLAGDADRHPGDGPPGLGRLAARRSWRSRSSSAPAAPGTRRARRSSSR